MAGIDLVQGMKAAKISSWRELAQRSGVSRYRLRQLRQGNWSGLTLAQGIGLARVLNLTLAELLEAAQLDNPFPPVAAPEGAYLAEYQRLEQQLAQQAATIAAQVQREALHDLESWLRNWPKVVYALHHDKPDLLAVKIVPLLRPLEQVLQHWGVEPVGTIAQQLPFDPQYHQILSRPPGVMASAPSAEESSSIAPGTWVEVQRPGYTHQGKLLFRAEVIPVKGNSG